MLTSTHWAAELQQPPGHSELVCVCGHGEAADPGLASAPGLKDQEVPPPLRAHIAQKAKAHMDIDHAQEA